MKHRDYTYFASKMKKWGQLESHQMFLSSVKPDNFLANLKLAPFEAREKKI
jgi:hypothetical protein